MAEGYRIREHDLLAGETFLVLAPEGDPEDFFEILSEKPKQRERARLIFRTLEKIYSKGIPTSIRLRIIRLLEPDFGLAEVAVAGKVIRVMSYIHMPESVDPKLVLLFDFDGHQGTDKIPKDTLSKGRKLARAARLCMEEV